MKFYISKSRYSKVLVAQSLLTLCDPMDCSPPCFTIHGILQARILEWVGIEPMSLHWRQSLYYLRHQGSPTNILSKYPWLQFMETYNFIGTWWHLNPKWCINLRHWCQYLVCMQSEVYKWLSSYHIFVMYPNTDCFRRNITENSLTSTNVKPHKIKLHFKVLP